MSKDQKPLSLEPLKECPFCGHIPEIEISNCHDFEGDKKKKYSIRCCYVVIFPNRNKKEIIEKWNTRALPSKEYAVILDRPGMEIVADEYDKAILKNFPPRETDKYTIPDCECKGEAIVSKGMVEKETEPCDLCGHPKYAGEKCACGDAKLSSAKLGPLDNKSIKQAIINYQKQTGICSLPADQIAQEISDAIYSKFGANQPSRTVSVEEIKKVISDCIKDEIAHGFSGGIYPEVVAQAVHALLTKEKL